jgi:hypothetical protein
MKTTTTRVGAAAAMQNCGENKKSQVITRIPARPKFGNPDLREDFFARVGDLRVHPAAPVPAEVRRKYLNIMIEDMRYFGYSGYHPVTATMEPNGKHFVVKGGVRYEAALQAGVAFLPCVLKVFKSDDELRRYAESDEARGFNSFRDC